MTSQTINYFFRNANHCVPEPALERIVPKGVTGRRSRILVQWEIASQRRAQSQHLLTTSTKFFLNFELYRTCSYRMGSTTAVSRFRTRSIAVDICTERQPHMNIMKIWIIAVIIKPGHSHEMAVSSGHILSASSPVPAALRLHLCREQWSHLRNNQPKTMILNWFQEVNKSKSLPRKPSR